MPMKTPVTIDPIARIPRTELPMITGTITIKASCISPVAIPKMVRAAPANIKIAAKARSGLIDADKQSGNINVFHLGEGNGSNGFKCDPVSMPNEAITSASNWSSAKKVLFQTIIRCRVSW